ncbi:MAG: class I SAM-dependent methyltransferase [bacterium]|nr:class I SAM-dependent methyltransferase [bacterium]
MNKESCKENELLKQWKRDEQASFIGWDFSYLAGRWEEECPPWDYESMAQRLVKNANSVLDMGTGGGEIFSSFAPFSGHTVAIEGYKPNITVAKRRLEPLGVKVLETDESDKLPFKDKEFELILNRHSAFSAQEVYRILKGTGIFLTQQLPGSDKGDLIKTFDAHPEIIDWGFDKAKKELLKAGFSLKVGKEWTGKMKFKDVGAVVYYLKALPWLVEGFSVEKYLPYLRGLQKRIDEGKELVFTQQRFLILAEK